ncbi:hypothetical protein, partial [Azohydromonas sp.]|uniref:hypothetical protein n=1 Tax=Azohydromonas sp. TaxID=1872666 RepID=UPI002D1FB8F2
MATLVGPVARKLVTTAGASADFSADRVAIVGAGKRVLGREQPAVDRGFAAAPRCQGAGRAHAHGA